MCVYSENYNGFKNAVKQKVSNIIYLQRLKHNFEQLKIHSWKREVSLEVNEDCSFCKPVKTLVGQGQLDFSDNKKENLLQVATYL